MDGLTHGQPARETTGNTLPAGKVVLLVHLQKKNHWRYAYANNFLVVCVLQKKPYSRKIGQVPLKLERKAIGYLYLCNFNATLTLCVTLSCTMHYSNYVRSNFNVYVKINSASTFIKLMCSKVGSV